VKRPAPSAAYEKPERDGTEAKTNSVELLGATGSDGYLYLAGNVELQGNGRTGRGSDELI
jgi:hypothetical protein